MQLNLQDTLHEESKPNVFKKLLQPALEKVKEQEQQLLCYHNQTYDYSAFFRALIFYLTTEIKSLRSFINTYLKLGLLPKTLEWRPVPYTTFGDAFEHFDGNRLQEVFEHLLSTFKIQVHPKIGCIR